MSDGEGAAGRVDDADDVAVRVRSVLAESAQLSVDATTLAAGDSLYEAGMSSRAGVNLMLALENEFEVEFPDALLRRDTFESVASIAAAVRRLLGGP